MIQSAVMASVKYGGSVHGTNSTLLREARSLQAHVQSNRLAGKSVTLLLMLSDKPSSDPAFQLQLDPLLAFATA
eukprot:485574-Pyramimonas_sp.AAC.1